MPFYSIDSRVAEMLFLYSNWESTFFWKSHHRPREGPFQFNDVFAIINVGPAIALMACGLSCGFFNKGLVPGIFFGFFGVVTIGLCFVLQGFN
jgi:hypothetical protein